MVRSGLPLVLQIAAVVEALARKLERLLIVAALNFTERLMASTVANRVHDAVYALIGNRWDRASVVRNLVGAAIRRISGGRKLTIGLIVDGNRRYARKRNLAVAKGHEVGYHLVEDLVKEFQSLGCIRAYFFVLGKKNYKRPQEQLEGLYGVFEDGLERHVANRKKELEKNLGRELNATEETDKENEKPAPHICAEGEQAQKSNEFYARIDREIGTILRHVGRYKQASLAVVGDKKSLHKRPAWLVGALERLEGTEGSETQFMCMGYSSIENYVSKGSDGIRAEVDIIVRTGGERRLSDFFLCNASRKASLAFLKVNWPMLTSVHLLLVILKHKLESRLVKMALATSRAV